MRRYFALIFLWIFNCCSTGCLAFYTYRPVQVAVYDAETDKPISGASVLHGHGVYLMLNPPRSSSAVTDVAGKATIETTDAGVPMWQVSAPGYLPLNDPIVRADAKTATFYLFHEPVPKLTVIVPNGYRGMLKLDFRLTTRRITEVGGKRDFTYKASLSGYVGVDATPLLQDINIFKINFVYENGQHIPWADYRYGPRDNVLRYVTGNNDDRKLLVLGTQQDEDRAFQLVHEPINGDTHNVRENQAAFDRQFVP